MTAVALFWIGFGLCAAALIGLGLAICRAGALADEDLQRALRQERAARAGLAPHTGHVQVAPRHHEENREA